MVRPLIALLALGFAAATLAQTAPTQQTSPPAAAKTAAKPVAKAAQAPKKVRPTWAELAPQQQEVLAPLKPEWDKLDRDRRLKWIGIAKRYPKMKPEEQAKMQRRMHDWASLTPEQRRQARENYKNMIAKTPPEKRRKLREQWAEYQALPPQEREELLQEKKKR
jgi:hypothetical protein